MKSKHFLNAGLLVTLLTAFLSAPPAFAQTAFDCSTVTEIPQAECEALVALYNATGGEEWHNAWWDDWLQTTTPCTWDGVTCGAGHVIQLDLSENNVNGPLPPEFGNLSNLTSLNLNFNALTSLPSEFGNLSNLSYLHLSSNALTSLPPEFDNLSNLLYLDLSGNDLTSLPPEFGNLSNLTHLQLSYTPLTALPPEFGNLSNLTRLQLSYTPLTSLPPEFGNLSNLLYLYLSGNDLTVLPSEFGDLSNLTTLDLQDNNLASLPPEFGNFSNLSYLYLSGNALTSLPPEFGNLSNLSELRLEANALTSLPPEFGNLSNLSYLNLSSNTLTSLPPEFGNLSNLTRLYLSYNLLTTLPPEFGNLSNLSRLILDENDLKSLPPEFGNLSNLSYLNLGGNDLTSLPPEFGNLSNLLYLYLHHNPLQGSIPEFMTGLTSLSIFDFDETEWCEPPAGPVPTWLAGIRSVYKSGLICRLPDSLEFSFGAVLFAHIAAPFTATVAPVDALPITFTWDSDSSAPITHTRETSSDTAWLTWDTPGPHTLTVTAANEFGTVTATQSVFVQPVSSTTLLPDAPARLVYTDTHGSPTTLDIPSGSVTQTSALLYRPQPDPALTPTWQPAGHSFTLDLYRDGFPVPDPTFSNPLTLTLHYTDTDLANVDRPAGLQLMRLNADGWHPAACGPVSRDLEQHSLSLPLCNLGTFALFGPATLTKFVEPTTPVQNGDTLTYTLVFSDPEGSTLRIFDPLSPTLEWQGFVSPGAVFSNVIFTNGTISGTLTLPPTHILSISFTVRTQLPDDAFIDRRVTISNTASFCPADESACILQPSNSVSSDVFIRTNVFLPLVLRTLWPLTRSAADLANSPSPCYNSAR